MKIESAYYVNEYLVQLAYGGPEEGGWWFDVGEFIGTKAIYTEEEEAYEHCRRLNQEAREQREKEGDYQGRVSVNSDGDIEYHVDEEPGQDYPQERPHYE